MGWDWKGPDINPNPQAEGCLEQDNRLEEALMQCNAMGKEEDVWLKGKGQCVFEVRAVAYGTPQSFGKLRTHSKNIETFWQC